ncbi:hypothetical protein P262_01601 [Cronobacter malonaticus]|uniref:Uncharacterized protein n=1 Tax=Cronobacter malonaticus TaxID=413503 RepID=V5TW26_9ENTR|nr:hypothetical protein P262_01601 [Cronobacter malonaticus]
MLIPFARSFQALSVDKSYLNDQKTSALSNFTTNKQKLWKRR